MDENPQQAQENAQELEQLKSRLREMEEESEKFKRMQDEADKQMSTSDISSIKAPVTISLEEKMEIDARSIYVGNVDYSATADDLERHFHGCGSVNRVTILQDKFTGAPKGFAYVEFAEKDSVQIAIALDESSFKGRIIKVCPKRTNRPGMSMRMPRGNPRGFRGRGGYIGAVHGGGFRPSFRGRGRGRGGYGYAPY